MDLFLQVIFLTFEVDLILQISYLWIFREDLFLLILLLLMFYLF